MLALLKKMAVNWWGYHRTLHALEQLDQRLLADLSIDEERLKEIAWRAARSGGSLSIYDLKADHYECAGGMPAPMSPPRRWTQTACEGPCLSPKPHLKRAA